MGLPGIQEGGEQLTCICRYTTRFKYLAARKTGMRLLRVLTFRLLVTLVLAALLFTPTVRGDTNTTSQNTTSNETVKWVNETGQLIYLGETIEVGNYSITAYEVRPDAYLDAVTENEGKNESCQPYPRELNASLLNLNASYNWSYPRFEFNKTGEYRRYIGSTFTNLSQLIEKRRVLGCDDWMLFRVTRNSKVIGEMQLGGGEGAIVFDERRRLTGIYPSQGVIEKPGTKIIIKVKYLITGHLNSSYAVTGSNTSYSTFYLPYAVIDVMTAEEDVSKKNPYLGLKFNKIFQLYRDTRHSGLIYVTLEMENRGQTDYQHIQVTDKLPPGFVLAGPYQPRLDWNFSLPRGRTWAARYSMKLVNPLVEKTYTIPQAEARVSVGRGYYYLNSTSPWIPNIFQTAGAIIRITKTASRTDVEPGENVTITVRIENLGNRTAIVWVRDYLPPGTELLSGTLDFKHILQPRDISRIGFPLGGNTTEEVNLTHWNTSTWYYYENKYTIRITGKSVTLPPAEAVYKDFYNNSFQEVYTKLYKIVSIDTAVKIYRSTGDTLRSNPLSFGLVEILKPRLKVEAENNFDFGILYPGSQTRWLKLKLKNTGTDPIEVRILGEGIFRYLQFYQGEKIEDSYHATIPPGGSVQTRMRLKIPSGYTPRDVSRIVYVVTGK